MGPPVGSRVSPGVRWTATPSALRVQGRCGLSCGLLVRIRISDCSPCWPQVAMDWELPYPKTSELTALLLMCCHACQEGGAWVRIMVPAGSPPTSSSLRDSCVALSVPNPVSSPCFFSHRNGRLTMFNPLDNIFLDIWNHCNNFHDLLVGKRPKRYS